MRRYWPWLLFIPVAALTAAGWALLPEELVVQIGLDGQPSNVQPKALGLLIPVGISALGAFLASSGKRRGTGLALLAVGFAAMGIPFLWNL